MDRKALLWKLGAFGKFDFKKFRADALQLKVLNEGREIDTNAVSQPTKQSSGSSPDRKQTDTETTDTAKKRNKKEKKKRSAAQIAALKEEQIREIRNHHQIHVHGADVPNPLKTFQELESNFGVSKVILRNIEHEGYKEPTAIQRQVAPAMLQGRDVMACAPTGSGKTAAFILPVLHHLKASSNVGFRALVLAPTRELAKQTLREFRKLSKGTGLRACYIETGEKAKRVSQEQIDILVSTPNRLVFMLEQDPSPIAVNNVEWLIVDESDKLFEAGSRGFRDQLGVIYKACSSPKLHRAMFSATFAHDVEEWCKLNLDNVLQIHVGARNSAIRAVEQKLIFTGDENGKLFAFRGLVKEGISPPVLIFVQSKERAAQLFMELKYDNIKVDVIHSGRSLEERDAVIRNYRLGNIWFLICTELMGRGIDFKGVNLVINYDFPTSAVSYIHRIGRTGRAGRQGKAVTFFTEIDKTNLRSIANVIQQAGCPVPDYMLAIKKPKKQERQRLAKQIPERKTILTMDPQELAKLKKRRKGKHGKSQQVSGETKSSSHVTKPSSGFKQKKKATHQKPKQALKGSKFRSVDPKKNRNSKNYGKGTNNKHKQFPNKRKAQNVNPQQTNNLKRKRTSSGSDNKGRNKRVRTGKQS